MYKEKLKAKRSELNLSLKQHKSYENWMYIESVALDSVSGWLAYATRPLKTQTSLTNEQVENIYRSVCNPLETTPYYKD